MKSFPFFFRGGDGRAHCDYALAGASPEFPVCDGARLLLLLRHGIGVVLAVVLPLDFLDDALHLLALLLPLGLGHLELLAEQLVVGLAVRAAEAVPECGVLAVVVVEVEAEWRVR